MAFAQEVQDFVSAFGAMQKALGGSRSEREARAADTAYKIAAADKLRWDMGEDQRLETDILTSMDGGGGGGGGGSGGSGGSGGFDVASGVDMSGLTPEMRNAWGGLVNSLPPELRKEVKAISAYRDPDKQGRIRASGVRPAATAGNSWHQFGQAIDASGSARALAALYRNAGKFGLANPVPNDPNHFQLVNHMGVERGEAAARAYQASLRGGGGDDIQLGGRAIPSSSVGSEALSGIADALGGGREDTPAERAPMEKYRNAIAAVESGGESDPYRARGIDVGGGNYALGRYQIMKSNLAQWTQEVFGEPVSEDEFLANPGMQDQVFDAQFGKYLKRYGNPQDAMAAWFGGPGAVGTNRSDPLGQTVSGYVSKAMAALGGGGGGTRGGGGGTEAIFTDPNNPPDFYDTPAPPTQFDQLQDVLEAGGQEQLPEFPGPMEARTKDDALPAPQQVPPTYTVGADLTPALDTDRIAQIQAVQGIDEQIPGASMIPPPPLAGKDDALEQIGVGPRAKDDSVSEMMGGGRGPPVIDITPEVDRALQAVAVGAGDMPEQEIARARMIIAKNIARSHQVSGDDHAILMFDGNLMVEDENGEFTVVPDRSKDDAVAIPTEVSPTLADARTKDDAYAPTVAGGPPAATAVPLPTPRPDVGGAPAETEVALPTERPELPGTEPAGGTPEAVPTGFDPLPQTSGHTDPVSEAGHETLSNAARGVPNRHKVPFPRILKSIRNAGKRLFGIEDGAIDTDDDHPGRAAFTTGVGGFNVRLIKAIEDKLRDGNPNIGEEELRMEVISTLWNYFYERGDYQRGDTLAWSAHQSYMGIAAKYLALAKVNAEEGNLEQAVENYLAAFSMVPDGDIVDAKMITGEDGNPAYEMTVKDVDTGEERVLAVKTPDEIAADIMNMETEDFHTLIERKVRGKEDTETEAERRAREAEEALKEQPFPPTAGEEEAVTTAPGETGSGGEDMLEDEGAIPEVAEAPSIVPAEQGDAEDIDGGDEAVSTDVIPGITSDAEPPPSPAPGYPGPIDAVSPPKPVPIREFNAWLEETQPVSLWNDRFQQRNAQEKAYNEYWKLQADNTEDQLKAAEAERNRLLVQGITDYMSSAPADAFLDVEEDMLGLIGDTEDRNSIRSLWDLRNKNALELRSLSEADRSSQMLTEGMIELDAIDRFKVKPPKGGGDTSGAVSVITGTPSAPTPPDLSKLKPGQFTPNMFLHSIEGGYQQLPRPEPNQQIRSMLRGDDLKSYDAAVKAKQEYVDAYNKTFYPPPLTAEQQQPKPPAAEDSTWMARFVGDYMGRNDGEGLVTSGDGSTGGMLGAWLAFNTKVKGSDPAIAANLIRAEILDNSGLQPDIGLSATELVNTGMSELEAFTTVTNMLTIPAKTPFSETYKVMPHPDDPRMVAVEFMTPGRPQGGDNVVNMPRATFETLDEWHGVLQARFLNSQPSPEGEGTDTTSGTAGPQEVNPGGGLFLGIPYNIEQPNANTFPSELIPDLTR